MRILFVGELAEGRTSYHRMLALKDIGYDVKGINTFSKRHSLPLRCVSGVFFRCGYPLDIERVNCAIKYEISKGDYDLLWLDKTLMVKSKTLIKLKDSYPQCRIIFYSPDDMMNQMNQSIYYLSSLPLYDMYFTTKSFNVNELLNLGCKKVIYVKSGYDSNAHKPIALAQDEFKRWQADVSFIGGYELDRFEWIFRLAQNSIPVRVIGSFWDKMCQTHPNIQIIKGDLVGQEYSKAICASRINLCFLRKVNRDLHTTRSFEIPAHGAFMLAERTDEHLSLFEEGREAEFFENDDELFHKIRYYLKHENERQRIAIAGRERCLKSGYSNHDRMKEMIRHIQESLA